MIANDIVFLLPDAEINHSDNQIVTELWVK